MLTTTKPFLALTAADLMTHDVVRIPKEMSLRSAAHTLARHNITGAPVVDSRGRCVGVISATDFLRWAEDDQPETPKLSPSSTCVCSDWQVVDLEEIPTDAVSTYMTPDPVMVEPAASVVRLAQQMLDAHIHRVIVVDKQSRPVGVVSSLDILAAVAYAESDRK